MFSRNFFRFAACCAFASALTTFGVHLLPLLHPANTFEEQLLLSQNPIYKLRLWIVLIHILFVLASMWGIAAVKYKTAAGWIGLGLGGYWIFGLAEFFRVSFALNAITPWRARLLNEPNPEVRELLKENLLSWPQINDALFFLLIFGFLIGNLCYAVATVRSSGLEKWISNLLFVWAVLGCVTLFHEFLNQSWMNFVPEFVSYTFQPLVRVLIGIWLWKQVES
ncbi:hypothetical protein L0244_05635 [bacterium]|nr:hypothetical protein [bacterium]MCI0612451.1 hypothetical protein [bacterium]